MSTKRALQLRAILTCVGLSILNLAIGDDNYPSKMETTSISLSDANALLNGASNNAISAVQVFPGPDGLTGAVMHSTTGATEIAWITPGSHIFVGLLLDATGKNLSQEARNSFIDSQDRQINQSALMDAVQSLRSVAIGDPESTKSISVFADPNCHFCAELFQMIKDTDLDDVRIQWIPIAILGQRSLDLAITIINDDDGSSILEKKYGNQNIDIPTMRAQDPRYEGVAAEITAATRLFQKMGNGTPLIVYWNGNAAEIVPGLPSSTSFKAMLQAVKVR